MDLHTTLRIAVKEKKLELTGIKAELLEQKRSASASTQQPVLQVWLGPLSRVRLSKCTVCPRVISSCRGFSLSSQPEVK